MAVQNEYCITVGEFIRLCQTTRDTLRYYEKQGILVPQKSTENGYHYYSYAQISSYYFIKTFRDLGCSVADIKAYLLSGEQVRFDEFVDTQYNALLRERERLEQKIAVIGNTRKILQQMRANDTGKPELYNFTENMHIKLTPIMSVPAYSSGDIAVDIQSHLKQCDAPGIQAFPLGATIAADNFVKSDYVYQDIFSFADAACKGDDICQFPTGQAVVRVCTEDDGDIKRAYREIQEFIKEGRYTLRSDLFSLSIVNVLDPHEERRYLKFIFAFLL